MWELADSQLTIIPFHRTYPAKTKIDNWACTPRFIYRVRYEGDVARRCILPVGYRGCTGPNARAARSSQILSRHGFPTALRQYESRKEWGGPRPVGKRWQRWNKRHLCSLWRFF